MKLVLLPGLDGTGDLFADFVAALRQVERAAPLPARDAADVPGVQDRRALEEGVAALELAPQGLADEAREQRRPAGGEVARALDLLDEEGEEVGRPQDLELPAAGQGGPDLAPSAGAVEREEGANLGIREGLDPRLRGKLLQAADEVERAARVIAWAER